MSRVIRHIGRPTETWHDRLEDVAYEPELVQEPEFDLPSPVYAKKGRCRATVTTQLARKRHVARLLNSRRLTASLVARIATGLGLPRALSTDGRRKTRGRGNVRSRWWKRREVRLSSSWTKMGCSWKYHRAEKETERSWGLAEKTKVPVGGAAVVVRRNLQRQLHSRSRSVHSSPHVLMQRRWKHTWSGWRVGTPNSRMR
ncbi:hypothetical protein GBAR_LOCUS4626 [Geodia barretti]|uniref:Uncharacterized protein n=1 Tax=Geodia barretti TaxID=519541 RepID=A0AA35W318_GEOBA|nr:hypothetical protein GBAR_LOCUS4626 [Geodia barretti]